MKTFTPPRTADGKPDFTGFWNRIVVRNMENIEEHPETMDTSGGRTSIIDPADGKPGTYLFFYPAVEDGDYSRHRPGLQHLAFMVKTRQEVDRLHAWAAGRGATVLHAPREFPQYGPAYYATFPAPATLAELKDVLEKRYAIDLPLTPFAPGDYVLRVEASSTPGRPALSRDVAFTVRR